MVPRARGYKGTGISCFLSQALLTCISNIYPLQARRFGGLHVTFAHVACDVLALALPAPMLANKAAARLTAMLDTPQVSDHASTDPQACTAGADTQENAMEIVKQPPPPPPTPLIAQTAIIMNVVDRNIVTREGTDGSLVSKATGAPVRRRWR